MYITYSISPQNKIKMFVCPPNTFFKERRSLCRLRKDLQCMYTSY